MQVSFLVPFVSYLVISLECVASRTMDFFILVVRLVIFIALCLVTIIDDGQGL